jgi:2-iminobutanoate/2-iminopropanoate deaminase
MKDSKTLIVSEKLPSPEGPYSYGVKAGGWVFTAGMMGVDGAGNLVGKTSGRPDVEMQTQQTLQNLTVVLEELGASIGKVAKVNGYITDFRYFDQYNATYRKFFKPPYPARATHSKGLAVKDAIIEVDAIATVSGTPREIRSPKLAEWDIPCAQGGTQVGNVIFSSGHLPCDMKGKLVKRGDIRVHAEQVLDNIGATLEAVGYDFSDVIKINTTVPDWYEFLRYNEIRRKYFQEPFEASATIQGNIEIEGALCEAEVVAVRGQTKRTIESEIAGLGHFSLKRRADTLYPPLPPTRGPYSNGVQVDDLVYLVGQTGYEPPGRLVGPSDIRAQTKKTMENHQICMDVLGGKMDDVVKTIVSITDYRLIPAFYEEYAKFFSPPYPAMTLVVAGVAEERMVLEVEVIAVLGASKNAVVFTGKSL